MTYKDILAAWAKIAPITLTAREFAAEMAGCGRVTVECEMLRELARREVIRQYPL